MRSSDSAHDAGWWRQALAILRKDLTAELRNRSALNAILLFAVTTLVVVSFSVGAGADLSVGVKAALLWVVLYFAAFSGLAHVFLHEEERGTSMALRLSAAPGAVYAGKLMFNLLLMAVITLVVAPCYALMINERLAHPAQLVIVILSGGLGLCAAATIVAAIIAKARGKGALFGALGFPVLLPLLLMVVSATKNVLSADFSGALFARDIVGLLAFGVMLITASALLFPFVWDD